MLIGKDRERVMAKADLRLYIEGSRGRHGNVLAHVLHAKLGKLLAVLNQFDRKQVEVRERRVDYEISDAKKFNPTFLELHPVARVPSCDVAAVMEWTFSELEAVAMGGVVDPRVDAALAKSLVDLAELPNDPTGLERFWLELNGRVVGLDDEFRRHSALLAARRIAIERPTIWKQGASLGSVVGYLSQVGDLDGEAKLVITPRIGPEKVECVVKDEDREMVKGHLWTMVRINGLLHYSEKSPFPYRVDMRRIEQVPAQTGKSLLDLRGIFRGKPRQRLDLDGLLNG